MPSASVARVQRGDISHMLSLAGQFQPYQVVDVHPKVSGFMKKINVDIGDKVRKGEVLAVLEVPELQAQLEASAFDMAQARAEITRAQHEIRRAEAVHAAEHLNYQRLLDTSKAQPGLVAQQELDDAQSKDLSSASQVDAAKAAADAAQQHAESAHANNEREQAIQDYTHVVAPIDGVVVWRYADTGALIQSGTNSNQQDLPIVRLAQSTLLRLRMPVPEDDVQYIHEGDTIRIRIDALSRSITGKIVRFTRNVNFETRTMETEVDVDNRDLSIAPGMYANARLAMASVHDVLTLPVEALVIHGSQQMVYVVDAQNRVRIRPVVVGLQASKLAEVKSGLEEGDRVIVGGQDKYSDGEQVTSVLVPSQASEEQKESGGVIDMKADDSNGGAQ
ncbi:efflux RND transporter periplasmic adaptor subunit [Silvibacterium dinghuense]|uniref:efflux RND transporter periplasmic adaptor subunit n=1 Tax=Silvibacterium dinghuense TaxID=1560006 RepID=UPI0013E95DF6|nr:efflux RND transporter periplasmic adaptor subunit [Silvibacterium dinghuense]GGH04432.1 secretion protein HlyD [Silvibacterium dinghuense]